MSEMQYRDVLVPDAREVVMNSEAWGAIVLIAGGDIPATDLDLPDPIGHVPGSAIRSMCITLRDALSPSSLIKALPTGSPAAYARFAGQAAVLVAAGIFTQEIADVLLALAERPAGDTPLTVRLVKGHVIPRTGLVVLNTGDYRLDALVECAQADAPHVSYGAFLASVIVEASA
jgi:hypothetical protein